MRENKTINISTKKANIKCIPTLDSFTETLLLSNYLLPLSILIEK